MAIRNGGGMGCYLLWSRGTGRTYVGATVNMARRKRQHNGELVGGSDIVIDMFQSGELKTMLENAANKG